MAKPLDLQKRSEYYLPKLNERAELNRSFLDSLDGEMLLGDIADKLLGKFPEKFNTFAEAMEVAADLSQQYGC